MPKLVDSHGKEMFYLKRELPSGDIEVYARGVHLADPTRYFSTFDEAYATAQELNKPGGVQWTVDRKTVTVSTYTPDKPPLFYTANR